MALFNNPWGKGSDEHDKWFKNPWKHDDDNEFIAGDTLPTIVRWEIKNSGKTSADNKCAACPVNLGIDPLSYSLGIELKAFIASYKPGYTFDIKRTRDLIFWELSKSQGWQKTGESLAKDDDTKGNTDEMLIPQTKDARDKTNKIYYIYSEDYPAVKPPPNTIRDATVVVVIMNMEESVDIIGTQSGKLTHDPNTQKWHARWYFKLTNGSWIMDNVKSSIGANFISATTPTD